MSSFTLKKSENPINNYTFLNLIIIEFAKVSEIILTVANLYDPSPLQMRLGGRQWKRGGDAVKNAVKK